jgi:hypothetical protein
MTTDRFSPLIRRHLIETADERPAHGQLETVLRSTAATPQQRSWLVRLRWLVDPAAPYANARIRYGAAALALLIVAAMVAILAGGGPSGRTVFEGRWTATDTTDRSIQTLVVDRGQAPNVHFEDDFSIDCQQRGEASTVYRADGTGAIHTNRLIVQFPGGGCTTRLPPAESFYDYDEATDSLLDHEGITWTRVP